MKINEKNKLKQLKIIKNNYIINNQVNNLKFIFSRSGKETNFSELKDLVTFHDSIKKREISIEEARHKQEKFNRYIKKLELEINLKSIG